jgi:outer membrane protein OmpA-like peptidoglycan-associated protein
MDNLFTGASDDVFLLLVPLLDGPSLVRLSRSSRYAHQHTTGTTPGVLRWCAALRGVRAAGISTVEHLELAECMNSLSTSILFEYRSYRLEPSSVAPLERFAAFLRRHAAIRVSIEGHCGLEAPPSIAYTFTRQRAMAVREVLETNGVALSRLYVKGWGNERPLVWGWGDGTDGRAGPDGNANRRVELYVATGGIGGEATGDGGGGGGDGGGGGGRGGDNGGVAGGGPSFLFEAPARRPMSAYAVDPDLADRVPRSDNETGNDDGKENNSDDGNDDGNGDGNDGGRGDGGKSNDKDRDVFDAYVGAGGGGAGGQVRSGGAMVGGLAGTEDQPESMLLSLLMGSEGYAQQHGELDSLRELIAELQTGGGIGQYGHLLAGLAAFPGGGAAGGGGEYGDDETSTSEEEDLESEEWEDEDEDEDEVSHEVTTP